MNESTPIYRSRNLRARASSTDQLSLRDPQKIARQVLERREALTLLPEMEAYAEGVIQENIALLSRVAELARTAIRSGTNGHSWRKDLPDKANPTEFYQALCALVRWIRDRPKRFSVPEHDDTRSHE